MSRTLFFRRTSPERFSPPSFFFFFFSHEVPRVSVVDEDATQEHLYDNARTANAVTYCYEELDHCRGSVPLHRPTLTVYGSRHALAARASNGTYLVAMSRAPRPPYTRTYSK